MCYIVVNNLRQMDTVTLLEQFGINEKLAPSVRSLKSLKIEADALLTQVNKALE